MARCTCKHAAGGFFVAFYLTRRFNNGFTSALNHIHNEFNEAVVADLLENDMLFIKEYGPVCTAGK